MTDDVDGGAETGPAVELARAEPGKDEEAEDGPPHPTMEQMEAQQRFFALCEGSAGLMRQAGAGFRRTDVPAWADLCDALALILDYAVAGYPVEKMSEVLSVLRSTEDGTEATP